MALLLLFAFVALAVSFLCSIFEAVLLSVTPSFIAANEGGESRRRKRTGTLLRQLKGDVDRPLAAILSLNTIAHTAGAAGVGAQAQKLYGNAAVTTASVVMTLLILVFSEIIPKTIGAVYWKGLAAVVARTLRVLIFSMYPFVLMAQGITHLISRRTNANEVSREELGALAELGRKEGVIEEKESRMVQNLLRLQTLTAQDVMTPRTVSFMLQEDTTVGDVMRQHRQIRFSRIPVYRGTVDEVTGYALRDELLLAAARDDFNKAMADLRRDVVQVAEDTPLPILLERLLHHREQLAIVVDEFGGTSGVVTMEDVVETLLGSEILDEYDAVEDLRRLARDRWRQRAASRGILSEQGEEPGTPPSPS